VLQIGKFYPPHMGGIELHLEALSRALAECVDMRVLVANHCAGTRREFIDGVPVIRARVIFNLAGAPICPEMIREIRSSGADLVHIHVPNPAAVLAYLASNHRGLLVVTWHADTVRQKMLEWCFGPFRRIFVKRASALVATSPNYIESSPVLSANRARCHVIPYGIPVERFSRPRPAAIAAIRSEHGPRIVLAVGRLVYYKGFEYLVSAMARINGRCLILGDGPLRSTLEARARALGVSDRVRFLGEIHNEELAPFYHACDVLVLPSIVRAEAFGIVQLEAMACGKPVVNTHLASGVPFASLDGETGFTVKPADVEGLAAAVNRLLDDPDLRYRLGQAALRRVREHFTVEIMAARTLALYRKLVAGTVVAPAITREAG
jgi:glycosyltransferase involved in cell wall biosynthesis